MKNSVLEFSVGIFALIGLTAMAWLSIKLARMEVVGGAYRPIYAHFTSISGLKMGASIEIAGVEVGRVDDITLDLNSYDAKVRMLVANSVPVQEDAIASIRTKGLIGDRYVRISPGASSKNLREGDRIIQTEPAIQFEELISQFIHGSIK